MDFYVVDNHAFAWFIAEDHWLSSTAEQILMQAEAGDLQVLVSTLVLAELIYIAQRQRVPIEINEVLERMNQGYGFKVVPFDLKVVQTMLTLPDSWDIHDRIIAATARYYSTTLISRDKMLRASDVVQTILD